MMTAEELFNSICERIPEALIRHKVPGVALGITCDGQDFVRGFEPHRHYNLTCRTDC